MTDRKILGAILAGGQARRFGSDKALALWRGVPLLDHVALALSHHVDAVVICGREHPGYRALPDTPAAGLGPLGGLNAALAYALANDFQSVVTMACDTPVVSDGIFDALLCAPGPAILAACPVIGTWPSSLAPQIDQYLQTAQDYSMRAWARSAGAEALPLPAPINVNEMSDLAKLHG